MAAKLENIVKEVTTYFNLADGVSDATDIQKQGAAKNLLDYVNSIAQKRNAPPVPTDLTPEEIATLAKTFISEENIEGMYNGFKNFLPELYKNASKNLGNESLFGLIIAPLEEVTNDFGTKGTLENSVEQSYTKLKKEIVKFSSETELSEDDVNKRAEDYVTALKIKDPKIKEWFKKRLVDKRNSKEMKKFYANYAISEIQTLIGANAGKFKDYSLSMTDAIGAVQNKSSEDKIRVYTEMYQKMNSSYEQHKNAAAKNRAEA